MLYIPSGFKTINGPANFYAPEPGLFLDAERRRRAPGLKGITAEAGARFPGSPRAAKALSIIYCSLPPNMTGFYLVSLFYHILSFLTIHSAKNQL